MPSARATPPPELLPLASLKTPSGPSPDDWRTELFKFTLLLGQLGADGTRVSTKSAASAATVPLLPALVRELVEHRSRQAGKDLRRVHATRSSSLPPEATRSPGATCSAPFTQPATPRG
jgi:hypothetical protein